jgi:excisionase family DNA binding protein
VPENLDQRIAEAILDHIRPELEELVDERVTRALARLDKVEPWLSTREAADYLGITVAAVRMRVRRGKLPAFYDGGNKLRFQREDLDNAMRRW